MCNAVIVKELTFAPLSCEILLLKIAMFMHQVK